MKTRPGFVFVENRVAVGLTVPIKECSSQDTKILIFGSCLLIEGTFHLRCGRKGALFDRESYVCLAIL